jgi:siroheme synthase (precorrin-2 oxidase/ferrochelatase)
MYMYIYIYIYIYIYVHICIYVYRRIAGAVLKSVDDGLMRQKIWSKMMTEPKANQEALGVI